MKNNIAIITGGYSAESTISLKSAKTVYRHLNSDMYHSLIVYIEKNLWYSQKNNKKYIINRKDFSVNIENTRIHFDAVFMALHGPPAENGEIQDYFDSLNIPYTCCNAKISAITFNKYICNNKLKYLGFSCAESYIYTKKNKLNIDEIISKVGLPCFIKPNAAGSSFGVSKVNIKEEIENAITKALLHDSSVLIESFIDGIEVSCGVFDKYDSMQKIIIEALPVTEIVSNNDFFDYKAKYEGESEEITPARISDKLKQNIQDITKKVYQQMNLKGICRIDFIIMKEKPYIIEINTIPGLSSESIIPQQIKESGYVLGDFFASCLEKSMNK